MDIVESPRTSFERVEEIVRDDQPQRPRRADTLPVRFDASSSRPSPMFTTRQMPQHRRLFRGAPIPQSRPSFDYYTPPRPGPANRYQAYYEDEEDNSYNIHNGPTTRHYIGREPSSDPLGDEPIIINRRMDSENPYISGGREDPYRQPRRPQSPAHVLPERIIIRERAEGRSRSRSRRHRRSTSSPYPSRRTRFRSRSRSRSGSSSSRQPRSPMRYHHSRRTHLSRRGQYYESSEDEDDDLNAQAFPFTLSRHNKSLLGSDSGFGSVSEFSEKSEGLDSRSALKASTLDAGVTRHITSSHYTGDGMIDGHHSVKITEIESSSHARKTCALFKWIHFEDPNMDIEHFQKNVGAINGLSEPEKKAISKLLVRVRKRFDKPIHTSSKAKAKYMLPCYAQEPVPAEGRSISISRTRTVSWMCVPYFCLAKYSSLTVRPSSHPIRTLMQTRSSLIQKERDLQQAVRLLPDPPSSDVCFHIAQVWFIVLDDSLIISCSRQSMHALIGDGIEFSSLSDPSRFESTILVSTRGSVLWSLPVSDCQDWFAFIAHFWEYWPRTLQFSYHGKVIGADDWPRILALANKSNGHARLELEFKGSPKEPIRGILIDFPSPKMPDSSETSATLDMKDGPGPSSPSLQTKSSQTSQAPPAPISSNAEFSVFMWLNNGNDASRGGVTIVTPESRYQQVERDLKEIDEFLNSRTNLNERLSYRRCPTKRRRDVYSMLNDERNEITTEADTNEKKRVKYETRVDILNAAASIYQFFLPVPVDGPIIGKFWGALHQILEYKEPNRNQDAILRRKVLIDRDEVLDWLKVLARKTVPFRDLFSHAHATAQSNIRIPEELTKSWLHLLMALVFAAEDTQYFDEQMTLCSGLIEVGMAKLVLSMDPKPLSGFATFGPSELVSFVTFQLMQDATGASQDILETYLDYMKILQADVETNPLDRGHQDRIVSLQQELSVISGTLQQQRRVIAQSQCQPGTSAIQNRSQNDYTRGISTQVVQHRETQASYVHTRSREIDDTYGRAPTQTQQYPQYMPQQYISTGGAIEVPMSGIDPSGVQGLLAQDAISLIDSRIRNFEEMKDQASDLASWNIQRIDSNKDRQEAAIYAFTIVTIIFLPLSTVAGILGMNTYDVRNMNVKQWVFWATALPLTVLIVTLCLIWAGELNNFWNGFSKLWKKKNSGGYVIVEEDFDRRRRDDREAEVVVIEERERPRYGLPPPSPRMRRSHNTIYGRESYV